MKYKKINWTIKSSARNTRFGAKKERKEGNDRKNDKDARKRKQNKRTGKSDNPTNKCKE